MSSGFAEPSASVGRLGGRVALVTGVGSDIGRGIAQRFAREGALVALVDVDAGAAGTTLDLICQAGGAACFCGVAPRDRAAADRIVAKALSQFGRLDILVAGADYQTAWAPLTEKTSDAFDTAHKSFRETWLTMQAAFRPMQTAGGGSIIALGSTYGYYTQRFIADYKATKAALHGLVLSAAHEWGPFGIRANLLETAADTEEFRSFRSGREPEVATRLGLMPLRRMGDVERDIGGAALFLASDDSRYLTGEVIHADGGEHLSVPVFEPETALAFAS